jgi:hypothetical protein
VLLVIFCIECFLLPAVLFSFTVSLWNN